MAIEVLCGECKQTCSFGDELAGKEGRCPQGHVVQVPAPKSPTARATPRFVLGKGDIEPVAYDPGPIVPKSVVPRILSQEEPPPVILRNDLAEIADMPPLQFRPPELIPTESPFIDPPKKKEPFLLRDRFLPPPEEKPKRPPGCTCWSEERTETVVPLHHGIMGSSSTSTRTVYHRCENCKREFAAAVKRQNRNVLLAFLGVSLGSLLLLGWLAWLLLPAGTSVLVMILLGVGALVVSGVAGIGASMWVLSRGPLLIDFSSMRGR